jgi:hypothetical protein
VSNRAVTLVAVWQAALGGCGEPAPRASEDAQPAPVRRVAAAGDARGVGVWHAVRSRDRALARRGAHGLVRGRLGEAVDRYRWLIDEDEGEGALAVRALFPAGAVDLPVGARVELEGAWDVDGERHWFWAVDSGLVFEGAAGFEPALAPGLVPATAPAPADAVAVSALARRGPVRFAVLAPPVKAGDGWAVADVAGGDQVAWLWLPGEGEIYGGQDLRGADEHWALAPGETYWVSARRVRRPLRPDAMAELVATSAPRRD